MIEVTRHTKVFEQDLLRLLEITSFVWVLEHISLLALHTVVDKSIMPSFPSSVLAFPAISKLAAYHDYTTTDNS